MKKTIPKKEILICDKCKAESKDIVFNDPFYPYHMRLDCTDRITGPLGENAGGKSSYDLCYKCMLEFEKWIKK